MTRPPFDPDAPDQFPDGYRPRRPSTRDEIVYVTLTHIVPAVCFTALGVLCGVVFSR